ncbi:hypothetical protein ACQ4WX_46955 [Streptomyces lasalocidi]
MDDVSAAAADDGPDGSWLGRLREEAFARRLAERCSVWETDVDDLLVQVGGHPAGLRRHRGRRRRRRCRRLACTGAGGAVAARRRGAVRRVTRLGPLRSLQLRLLSVGLTAGSGPRWMRLRIVVDEFMARPPVPDDCRR